VQALHWSARLACIRHAASVRPEPGSNSPKKLSIDSLAHKPAFIAKKNLFSPMKASKISIEAPHRFRGYIIKFAHNRVSLFSFQGTFYQFTTF
jgi:hypothetical protein